MVNKIFKCLNCNIYTLKEICYQCNQQTSSPKPPKYSPLDKLGRYRRKYHEMVHKTNL